MRSAGNTKSLGGYRKQRTACKHIRRDFEVSVFGTRIRRPDDADLLMNRMFVGKSLVGARVEAFERRGVGSAARNAMEAGEVAARENKWPPINADERC